MSGDDLGQRGSAAPAGTPPPPGGLLPAFRTSRAAAAAGAQLPPIKVWAIELGTTRTTLSRVLKKLEAEGQACRRMPIRMSWFR